LARLLRHVNGRPQVTHGFEGKSCFLTPRISGNPFVLAMGGTSREADYDKQYGYTNGAHHQCQWCTRGTDIGDTRAMTEPRG
jgi:hypothetical protein